MAIDPFSSPIPKQDKQQPTQPQQDDPNVFLDLLAAPFRGLEGAVEGVYNLADMVTFDALPDYDMSFLTGRKRLLGTSETVAGGMAEGVTQFLTGFVPFFGWASRAGKVAKAGSLTQKALGGPVRAGIAAGMASDFTVFDGQEARLSNLIQEFPELQNPVTEFLAASDDDPEAIGRFKNVLEGLGLEFAVGGLIAGLRGLKKGRNKRIETDDPDLTNQAVSGEMGDDLSVFAGKTEPEVLPTAATTPEAVDLSTKEGRRQRMEDWVRDAWQKKREEALKAAGKNPEDMPAGWEDTALKRVSEDIRAGNNTPDWMDTRELADTLPSTLDRETGEKLDFENEAWPRTGTLLDFLEGQEFSRIPDDIDTPTLKVEPEAPRPVSDDVRKVIDDAFENTNDELERGRRLNKIQLENSDDIDEVRKYVRTKVEDTLPDPGPKTLEEQKLEAYETIADVSEETAKNWQGQIDILDTVEKVREARLQAQVFKDVSRGLGEKLTTLIKELQAGGGDSVKAKIKNVLQEAFEFEAHYSALGREFSLGLGGRRISGRNRKIGLNEAEITNEGIRNRYLNESDFDKIVEKLKAGTSGEDIDVTVKKLLEMSKRTQGGKLNMLREYWINSILSGLRTQAVNVLGNGFTTIFSTLETAVGGIATGNTELTKVAVTSLFDFEMYKEAAKMGWKTAKDGENFLDPDFRAFDEPGRREAITAENLGMQQGDNGYEVVDKLGKFFRWPSRGLMATDEFFKQLNYRRTARIKATMEGIKQGITDPQDLAKYVTDRVQSVIRDGGQHYSQETLIREGTRLADEQGLKGTNKTKFINKHVTDNWNEDASALAEYAVDEARYLTFTGELQKGTLGNTIQTVVRNHPLASFILPFIRTPLNILKYAFERTPGVFGMKNERQKLFNELKSDDPTIKAQAAGRLATSAAITGELLMLAMGWGPNLTGGGPRDPKQKEALQATGWRPYSIKIGDQYISYQRLDPFATMLGVVADMRDTFSDNAGFQSNPAEEIFAATIITFQRNVTNKSYLAGLQMFTDAMSDSTGNKMERLIRNLSSSMLPMSGLMSQGQYGAGTQEQRELRSVVDGLMHKTPFMRDKLDPKRNLLGEAYMIENVPFIGAINPIAHSTDKNDPVFNELAKLGHAFRQPPSTYNGIIDLLEFTTDSGQTAHDRRLELLQTVKVGGRTLRQSLERLIKSRKYQRLSDQSEPGLPSPRISEINKLLRKYRTKALDRTITEFPELQNYYRRVTRAKKQFNQGADYTDILTLLQ